MKQSVRTDLALERLTLLHQTEECDGEVDGVIYRKKSIHKQLVHIMEVTSESAASSLCKPIGIYYTISLNKMLKRCDDSFIDGVQCVSEILKSLLPKGNKYLIACLGNPKITPDAIGPLSADHIMVTRHLKAYMPETFSHFSEVSLIRPGVLGTTGIESASLVKGAVHATKPHAVIVIDALAACNLSGLCSTIQICNTGIEPGSGVGNRRYALNKETLGVPVISLGAPTIVDLSTLLYNITQSNPNISQLQTSMMVTPQEIDNYVSDSAKLIAYGINFALHDDLTLEDVDLFVS